MIRVGTKFVVKSWDGTIYNICEVNRHSCIIEWYYGGERYSVSYETREVERHFKKNIWVKDLTYSRKLKLDRLKKLMNNNE